MQVDAGVQLIAVLALMFFGALGAGSLPFFLRVKEQQLNTLATLGGGLLIGSALAVVIPEGFHSFAEANEGGHDVHGHDDHEHHGEVPNGLTGLALVFGFLLMLVLDQLQHGSSGGGHSHHHHHHHHVDADDVKPKVVSGSSSSTHLSQGQGLSDGRSPSMTDLEAPGAVPLQPGSTKPKGSTANPNAAISGLLIHCAADGLAMGAATLSGNATLSMIVGTAMVLHKAPMALGLSTYLMSCHWSWAKSQRTLIIFSATAPASALVTYALLGSVPMFTTPLAVSLILLFSGGTFLYAATMHILPEVLGGAGCGMSRHQMVAVVVGCLLPVLLSWGHEH